MAQMKAASIPRDVLDIYPSMECMCFYNFGSGMG